MCWPNHLGNQNRLSVTSQLGEKRNSTFAYTIYFAYEHKFLTGISKLLFRDSLSAIIALICDNVQAGFEQHRQTADDYLP